VDRGLAGLQCYTRRTIWQSACSYLRYHSMAIDAESEHRFGIHTGNICQLSERSLETMESGSMRENAVRKELGRVLS